MRAPIEPCKLQPCTNASTLRILANRSPVTYWIGTLEAPKQDQWGSCHNSIACAPKFAIRIGRRVFTSSCACVKFGEAYDASDSLQFHQEKIAVAVRQATFL